MKIGFFELNFNSTPSWKSVLIALVIAFLFLVLESVAFIWALNTLFNLGLEYSVINVVAVMIFLIVLRGGK